MDDLQYPSPAIARASSGLTSRRGHPTVQAMAPAESTPELVARLLSRQEAEQEDRVFWHAKTPEERLAAAEKLRQIAYGYEAATARIQKVVVRFGLNPGCRI
jgi:hypothetical protein